MQQPNPDMQAVLDKHAEFKSPPIESLTPANARNTPTLKNAVEEMAGESLAIRTVNLAQPMPQPVGAISHILIPTAEGEVLARVYTPKGDGPFPVLVYFHGGGWVIANLDVYEPSCRVLCNAAEAIVVSVAYRQAPEAPYPAAVDDAYAATQWVLQNAGQLNGDPNRVAVGGESAGGNLATVVCIKARDEGGKLPIAQLLVYPVTQINANTPSIQENANAKPLNAAMLPWFYNHYLGDNLTSAESDPYASPASAPSLSGLPSALVITAEIDPLRDEGENYARLLEGAGVPIRATRYNGVTHEFFGLAGLVAEAKQAVAEAGDWLKRQYDSPPMPPMA